MKKILIAATLVASMGLSACAGKSEASREQINKGREQAKEMIHATKRQGVAPAAKEQATPAAAATAGQEASVQPQDTDTLPE